MKTSRTVITAGSVMTCGVTAAIIAGLWVVPYLAALGIAACAPTGGYAARVHTIGWTLFVAGQAANAGHVAGALALGLIGPMVMAFAVTR